MEAGKLDFVLFGSLAIKGIAGTISCVGPCCLSGCLCMWNAPWFSGSFQVVHAGPDIGPHKGHP